MATTRPGRSIMRGRPTSSARRRAARHSKRIPVRTSTDSERAESVDPKLNPDELSEEQVAERVGTTPGRIRQLVELRILQPENGSFSRRDVLRARVLVDLEARGMDWDGLASA